MLAGTCQRYFIQMSIMAIAYPSDGSHISLRPGYHRLWHFACTLLINTENLTIALQGII